MPYLKILEALLGALPGSRAAILLDSQGELVVEAGDKDPRHRLIGAYFGITLQRLLRLAGDHPVGSVQSISSRYSAGHVALSPLKDGYYMVLSVSAETSLPRAAHALQRAALEMNQEL
jgi:hypothetical protein